VEVLSVSASSLLHILPFILLLALSGCRPNQRGGSFSSSLPGQLRISVLPFTHDKEVVQADSENLFSYYLEQLKSQPSLSIVEDPFVVKSLTSPGGLSNPELLHSIGANNLVEGILSGQVDKFYYSRTERSFRLIVGMTLRAWDTYTGKMFFEKQHTVDKTYRLRRKGQTDFVTYNTQVLDELFYQLNSALLDAVLKEIKDRHGSLDAEFPTASMFVNGEKKIVTLFLQPGAKEEKEQKKSEPVVPKEQDSSQHKFMKEMELKSEDQPVVATVTESKPVHHSGPRWLNGEKSKKASIMDKVLPETALDKKTSHGSEGNNQEKLELKQITKQATAKKIEKPTIPKDVRQNGELFLKINGFHLVYPLKLDPSKKYEKFYYLHLQPESAQQEGVVTEDNLILEIFSTSGEFAVINFLKDYFQGIFPVPYGDIPELFERNYLGKYQAGFVLGERAVVATGHRKYREELLNGLSGFYSRNGGKTIPGVIAQTVKSLRNLAEGTKEEDLFNKSLPVKPIKAPTPVKKPKPVVKKKAVVVKPAPPKKAPVKVVKKPKVVVKKPEPVKKAPVVKEKKLPVSYEEIKREPVSAPQVSNSPSVANSEKSVFLYSMAQRYYASTDYEKSLQYVKMAANQGYKGNDMELLYKKLALILDLDAAAVPESKVSPAVKTEQKPVSAPVVTKPLKAERFEYLEEDNRGSESKPAASFTTTMEFEQESQVTADSEAHPSGKEMLRDFYDEMEAIEKELDQIRKNRTGGMFTFAVDAEGMDFGMVIVKLLLLLALLTTGGIFIYKKH
jgi:hypothetical protein